MSRSFSFGVEAFSDALAGREVPVTFPSENAPSLVGMLHLPAELPPSGCPAVVLLHGFTGTKVEPHRIFVTTARRLAERGCVVLRFDFWGSGDSPGEFEEMTLSRELADAQAALDALENLAPVDSARIGVLGLSLGGAVASTLAGLDPRVRALVLWAPVSSDPPDVVERFLSEWANRPNPQEPWVEMGGFRLREAFFHDLEAWRARHLSTAMAYRGPVLIVHGSGDTVVPDEHGRRYAYHYARRPVNPRTDLIIVPEADHTFNRTDWEQRVIAATVDFFAQTLNALEEKA